MNDSDGGKSQDHPGGPVRSWDPLCNHREAATQGGWVAMFDKDQVAKPAAHKVQDKQVMKCNMFTKITKFIDRIAP